VMESNHPMPKQPDFVLHYFAITNFRCCSLDYVIIFYH